MINLKKHSNKAFLIILLVALIVMSGCNWHDLRITTSGLPSGKVGVYYDAWVHASQWVDLWAITGVLPSGIHFADGHFWGTPQTGSEGTHNITVEAIQYGPSGQHAYKGFSLVINP